MQIEQLQKHLETENVEFRGNCHDCQDPVSVLCATNEDGGIIVTGGALYNPKIRMPHIEQLFFKCDKCFENDKTLRNFVPCDVWSRAVGYLRPVNQWNKGKVAEFEKRKEFIVKNENEVIEKIGGDKNENRDSRNRKNRNKSKKLVKDLEDL